jgi:hypothetical protein
MKKPDFALKEFCHRLSDENVRFLEQRLTQRFAGDMAEVFDYLVSFKEIDRWFSSAETCDELFDMCDALTSQVQKEYERRNMVVTA